MAKKKYSDEFIRDDAWIIGIVDAYGSVDSKIYHFEEAETHGDIWPMETFKRWRWTYIDGFHKSLGAENMTIEDWDHIRQHVQSRYGIKFMDNGYHEAIIGV